jgi:hypothetical protein
MPAGGRQVYACYRSYAYRYTPAMYLQRRGTGGVGEVVSLDLLVQTSKY